MDHGDSHFYMATALSDFCCELQAPVLGSPEKSFVEIAYETPPEVVAMDLRTWMTDYVNNDCPGMFPWHFIEKAVSEVRALASRPEGQKPALHLYLYLQTWILRPDQPHLASVLSTEEMKAYHWMIEMELTKLLASHDGAYWNIFKTRQILLSAMNCWPCRPGRRDCEAFHMSTLNMLEDKTRQEIYNNTVVAVHERLPVELTNQVFECLLVLEKLTEEDCYVCMHKTPVGSIFEDGPLRLLTELLAQ